MRFYEYLRRLYQKELLALLVCILGGVGLLYLKAPSHKEQVLLIGMLLCSAIVFEYLWLKRYTGITTFKSLLGPRTFHLISFYCYILLISFFIEVVKFEYLFFIPFGIAMVGFHPFFSKRTMIRLYGFGFLSAAILFVKDYFIDPPHAENLSFNMGVLVITFVISAVLLFQSYLISQQSLEILKENKADLKKKNSELTQANSDIDAFIYKLSHDFREPITSIEADLKIIDQLSQNSSISEVTKSGIKSAEQLEYLIDKLTDFAKNSNRAILTQAIDLNELFVQKIMRIRASKNSDDLSIDFNPYQGDIFYSDKTRLHNIIENMLDNALRYSDPSKDEQNLEINLVPNSSGVTITFKDNGVGIADEDIDHIFKMFYRGQNGQEGQGLGLYVVFEAVKRLAGTISVSSELGKGTRFDIYLPSKKLL